MKPTISIESLDGGGWLIQKLDKTVSPAKVLTKKYVNTADVASLFVKTTTFDTGFLDKRIIRFARLGDKDIWVFIVPGLVRPIIHYGVEEGAAGGAYITKATWMPPSLWIIKSPVGASKKWDTRMCLVDINTGRTGRYPAPNVYGNGRICWGHILDTAPQLLFPRDFDKVTQYFFGSQFNTDLWNHQTPFHTVVTAMGKKKVIGDMADDERLVALTKALPTLTFDSTIDAFYKSFISE